MGLPETEPLEHDGEGGRQTGRLPVDQGAWHHTQTGRATHPIIKDKTRLHDMRIPLNQSVRIHLRSQICKFRRTQGCHRFASNSQSFDKIDESEIIGLCITLCVQL